MRIQIAMTLAAALLAATLPGCGKKGEEAAAALSVEESIEVGVTAKVKAIDATTRIVTLQDAGGHEVTLTVDPAVTRLNEVKVGDEVTAKYRASLLAELRPATAEEAAHPISAVTVAGKTPKGEDPAGGAGRAIRVVTTVEAVDVAAMRLTLKGPMGDTAVVRGRKRENLEKLRVGDTIVLTFAESLAVSLEKIAPR
jgi:hypothetical protein